MAVNQDYSALRERYQQRQAARQAAKTSHTEALKSAFLQRQAQRGFTNGTSPQSGAFDIDPRKMGFLQRQMQRGNITQEQALEQIYKPYKDFINQVNGVISGYDQFANNFNTRFGGRKYDMSDAYMGDSQQYLDEATAYNQQLIAQSNAILAMLAANPDAFDKETVEEIKSSLTMAQENAAAILKVAGEDNAYWSSWGNGAIDHEQELEEMQLLLAEWDATGVLRNAVEQDLPLDDDQQARYNRLVAAMKPYEGSREVLENAIAEKQTFLEENPDWASFSTAEYVYQKAQQDEAFAKKYAGKTGAELVNLINFIDDEAEKEWVTGEALRTMGFDEAQKDLDIMKQEYLELSQTGALRNHAAAGMTLSEEEKAAAEAAVAQYEAVMKKYGIDTSDEDVNPMEELSNLIVRNQQLIAESKKTQEYVRLSAVQENKDFAEFVEKGKAEAIEYAEKNKKTDHMTNKEIQVLAYYIGKDKENGTNTAETYKAAIKHYLKHRRAQEIADNINGMDIPVIEGLTRIGYNYLANMVRFGRGVVQNFNFGDEAIGPTVFELGSAYAGAGKDLNWFDRTAHKVAGVLGYMTPTIVASKLTGGATGIASVGKAAGSALLLLGSAGEAYGDALDKGYDKPAARAYSALVGLSETVLQNVLGGISEFGGLPAKLEGFIKKIKNALLKGVAKYGISAFGEVAEEELQSVLEPAFRTIIFGEEYDMPTAQEAIDTALVALLTTGALEGPRITSETIQDSKLQKLTGDQITQHSFLTSRERVVVNTITAKLVAEAEQSGKKLSEKEKQAIYDQAVEDMNTGRIDIKDIENSIGKGAKYEQLVSEFEELKELNKMNPMEMTGNQLDRRDELRKKNLEIGDKYGYGSRGYEKYIESYDKAFPKAVEGLVKSDRLSESYRERDRRSEAYQVEDLSVYSEAQRQTIQAAMDSGILNNTRRTHEFVELIAKLSEKMGVKFNFTDNKRLKESGFAIDGVTVNGYVNQDGITINVNSAKALNRVVGHEITHILEGTDLYDSLAMAVAAYAKTKGEYDSRLQQIRELYKGKEGYTGEEGANTRFQAELNAEAKLEKELIADLVGDYIFTDKAFVEKLFQEEPGLFKRIFEEIKYLCKLVTAGSKEARQLEKAKKMFTEVVREASENGVKNPTAEGGVKFAIEPSTATKYLEKANLTEEELRNGKTVQQFIDQVSSMVNKAIRSKRKLRIGSVSKQHASVVNDIMRKINPDFSADGYELWIDGTGAAHIEDRHGTNGKQDKSMATNEAKALIPWASQNASNGDFLRDKKGNIKLSGRFFNKDQSKAPEIFLEKKIDNDTVYVSECVPDSENKRIWITSAYIKKGSTGQMLNMEETSPQPTPEAPFDGNATTDIVTRPDESVKQQLSLSAQGQAETAGGGWDVRGQDVGLPMPEGYQESPVAVGASQQAQPVNLPGLEKSQPQSQGEAQEAGLSMPKQSQRTQSRGNAQADEVLPMPGDTVRAEQQSLDDEFRRQAGLEEDPSLYDPEEDEGVETTRDKLEIKQQNLKRRLDELQYLRDHLPERIAELQEKYARKPDKETKSAKALERKIMRLQLMKANPIELDKQIHQIQNRIGILEEKLQTSKPEKQDRLEQAYKKIDAEYQQAELELIKKYDEQRAKISQGLDDKGQWIKNNAFAVLWEMSDWVKGSQPSQILGRIWDLRVDGQRLEWDDIKHALADIKDGWAVLPNKNQKAIQEVLERTYQDRVNELTALDEKYNQDVEKLKKKAEQQKEEARKSEYRILRSDLHNQLVGSVKQAFVDKGMDFDTVLEKAKDLSTLKTVDNTPQRVLEKALGYKAGQVLSDMTFNKVAQNETEGIRWLNSYTDRKNGILKQLSEKYHIKPGSKESAAAQMYAEGFYVVKTGKDGEFVKGKSEIFSYGDAELARDFPDVQVQRNIKGLANDPTVRQIYDDTLDRINASRVRNGYPEIQKLDNYYLHFRAMEDFFSKLGLPFNPNDIRAKDLPTDLNGVTADLKPGQPYFASAQHREGKRTSFDLLGGLEMYLTSAKNQIFHIDDIQMLRALRNYVADIYGRANGLNDLDSMTEEEQEAKIKDVYRSHLSTFAKFLNESANVLAGKTALIDRGVEGFIGRRGLTLLNDVNKQVGAQAVGYNISSPMTNFLSVVQAVAKTEGFKMDFIRAAGRMALNKITRQDDGFAEKSSVIVRRKGADQFNRTLWQKLGDPGYWFMGKTDQISTELIARTKFNELTRKGMDEQTALYETDKWVSRLMGDRSLGQMPLIFNSKLLGLFTKFQLEVRNQLDSMYYDTIQETKALTPEVQGRNARIAAKVTSKFAQLAILQHVFGMGFQKVAGYNPAFDIISIIATAFGWNDDDDSEDTFQDNFEQALAELLEDLPYTSALTGGRIPIGNALPIAELTNREDQYGNEKPRWQTALEVLPYFVMPGGYGQAKKTVQGLDMYGAFDWLTGKDHSVPGNYTSDGRLRYTTDGGVLPFARDVVFGKWSGKNAKQYIEEGRSPLSEKQTEEFFDLGVSIEEYWEIQDGLKALNKQSDTGTASLNQKGDYIGGLNLTTQQKNILINNIAGRKEPIDMSTYGDYPNFEEFDYGTQNPGKYAVSQAVGGYAKYQTYSSAMGKFKADKDEDGNDVENSRKEKVVDYINSLNISYGEKIILYVSKYPSKESREAYGYDIVEYLNGRSDISEEQMRKILRELGFKVDWEGRVTWD